MAWQKPSRGGEVLIAVSILARGHLCKMAGSFSAGRKKGPFFFPPKKPEMSAGRW
jgi:hypothetical protein